MGLESGRGGKKEVDLRINNANDEAMEAAGEKSTVVVKDEFEVGVEKFEKETGDLRLGEMAVEGGGFKVANMTMGGDDGSE